MNRREITNYSLHLTDESDPEVLVCQQEKWAWLKLETAGGTGFILFFEDANRQMLARGLRNAARAIEKEVSTRNA